MPGGATKSRREVNSIFHSDREPAFENRNNLFRSSFLERRAKATRFWPLNSSRYPVIDLVRAKFLGKISGTLLLVMHVAWHAKR